MTSRRFVIVNAYSARNAGDAAIVLATAAVLRDTANAHVVSATRYYEQDRSYYDRQGIQVAPPAIPFAPRPEHGSGKRRVIEFAVGTLAAFAVAGLSRTRPQAALRLAAKLRLHGLVELLRAERVVVCGGGYLYSYQRSLNLTLLHATLCVKLAQFARKAPLMMPQSIGPLHRAADQRLVRWGFAGVRPIVARDHIAADEARSVMPASDVQICPDIAFYGWPTPTGHDANPLSRTVGIVLMDWTWARKVEPDAALRAYVEKLAAVARSLSDQGIEVRLYGHSRIPEMDQDDMAVAARVAEAVGRPDEVFVDPAGESADAASLHALFSELALVIGTRLHSCIVAMSAGTPAIGLAYQPKTQGTFRLLGLPDLALDVESFEADALAQLAVSLLDDTDLRHQVVAQVQKTRDEIRDFYDRQIASCE